MEQQTDLRIEGAVEIPGVHVFIVSEWRQSAVPRNPTPAGVAGHATQDI